MKTTNFKTKRSKIISVFIAFIMVLTVITPMTANIAGATGGDVIYDMQTVNSTEFNRLTGTGGSSTADRDANVLVRNGTSPTIQVTANSGPPRTVNVTGRSGTSQGVRIQLANLPNINADDNYIFTITGIFDNPVANLNARLRLEGTNRVVGTSPVNVDGCFIMEVTVPGYQILADAAGGKTTSEQYSIGNDGSTTPDMTVTGVVITRESEVEIFLSSDNDNPTHKFIEAIQPHESGSTPVSNRAELEAIKNNLNGKYHLTNHIDLSTSEWVPIDNFSGTLDGQGYTLNGLYVLASSNRLNAGLFGSTNGATIKNIGVYIGAQGVTAQNSSSSSRVVAGGLIGTVNNGNIQIINCYVDGNVSATHLLAGSAAYAGGLIGVGVTQSNANSIVTIESSYTTGNISATTTAESYTGGVLVAAGGVIGYTWNSDIHITRSYAIGNVSAFGSACSAGGLIGWGNNRAITITDCYATGDISSFRAGGLVGTTGSLVIENSYASGNVSGLQSPLAPRLIYVAGIMNVTSNAQFNNVYWNISKIQMVNGIPRLQNQKMGTSDDIDPTIPLTLAQMRNQSNFVGFDFDNVWTFIPGINDNMPVLISANATVGHTPESALLMSITRVNASAAVNSIPADGGVLASGSELTAWRNNTQIQIGGTGRTPIVINNSDNTWLSANAVGNINNASAFQIKFKTTGYTNIKFSAKQKSTNSGPGEFSLAYRIGLNGVWTRIENSKTGTGSTRVVPGVDNNTYSALKRTYHNFELPAAVDNQAEVYLRVFFDGPANLGANGNTSINDIRITSGDYLPPIHDSEVKFLLDPDLVLNTNGTLRADVANFGARTHERRVDMQYMDTPLQDLNMHGWTVRIRNRGWQSGEGYQITYRRRIPIDWPVTADTIQAARDQATNEGFEISDMTKWESEIDWSYDSAVLTLSHTVPTTPSVQQGLMPNEADSRNLIINYLPPHVRNAMGAHLADRLGDTVIHGPVYFTRYQHNLVGISDEFRVEVMQIRSADGTGTEYIVEASFALEGEYLANIDVLRETVLNNLQNTNIQDILLKRSGLRTSTVMERYRCSPLPVGTVFEAPMAGALNGNDFMAIFSVLTDVDNPTVKISDTVISMWNVVGELVIPETVEYKGTTYTVTAIGDSAFIFCEKLTSVTIPDTVTIIGENVFRQGYNLTSVTIGNSVTSIGYGAFLFSRNLTSLTIPGSVVSIGEHAFAGCTGLRSITNLATTPQTINADSVFQSLNRDLATLHVPDGTRQAYIDAGWTYFRDYYEPDSTNPEYVTISGRKYRTNLTELNLSFQQLTNDDIEQLSYMTNLTWLNLEYTGISNIEPLGNLTNLTWLNLRDNKIRYITGLERLENLEWLSLSENYQYINGQLYGIDSLEPLRYLTNLKQLWLSDCRITDNMLNPLRNLTNLRILNLSDNSISQSAANSLRLSLDATIYF